MQRLTFGQGRSADLGGLAHLAAEQVERAAKGDAGPRARLEEHVGGDGALQHPGHTHALGVRTHLVSHAEQMLHITPIELLDRQNVTAFEVQPQIKPPMGANLAR